MSETATPPEGEKPEAVAPPEPDTPTPAAQPPPEPEAPAATGRLEKTADERKAQLDSALQLKGAQGWRIENRSDFQATVAKGKQHSHGLHIFLTIITIGLWLLVWIPLVIFGWLKRIMLSVDAYGNVVEQKL